MTKRQSKPSWWILYVLVVLMIVVLIAASQDGLPNWANEIGDMGIIAIVFGAMALWVLVNTPALLDEEMNKPGFELHIEEYLPMSPSSSVLLPEDNGRKNLDPQSSPNEFE
jgi:hypothetical protein